MNRSKLDDEIRQRSGPESERLSKTVFQRCRAYQAQDTCLPTAQHNLPPFQLQCGSLGLPGQQEWELGHRVSLSESHAKLISDTSESPCIYSSATTRNLKQKDNNHLSPHAEHDSVCRVERPLPIHATWQAYTTKILRSLLLTGYGNQICNNHNSWSNLC